MVRRSGAARRLDEMIDAIDDMPWSDATSGAAADELISEYGPHDPDAWFPVALVDFLNGMRVIMGDPTDVNWPEPQPASEHGEDPTADPAPPVQVVLHRLSQQGRRHGHTEATDHLMAQWLSYGFTVSRWPLRGRIVWRRYPIDFGTWRRAPHK